MTDYVWPDDLVPFAQSFYLQPHTGGSESPFSRVSKIYGLSAPRWICSVSFRGGYNGRKDQAAFGPRIDALLAKMKGRQSRVELYDFRRSIMRTPKWPAAAGNVAATAGDTTITITGLNPGMKVLAGDYLGGDGRPHIILDDAVADTGGEAAVSFQPPLSADIATNSAIFGKPTGLFRLTSDDAGQNGVAVGELANITLDFVEDL